MGASKIANEQEVRRWFQEGRTYQWMVETYRGKYNVETTISMWSNFRRRHGLDRRVAWDDELVPWKVEERHRYMYPILMLRREARRRAGFSITAEQESELDVWIAGMRADGTVLHYDPGTDRGWSYVPRRDGIDTDLIREVDRPTGRRRAADRATPSEGAKKRAEVQALVEDGTWDDWFDFGRPADSASVPTRTTDATTGPVPR